MSQKPFRPSAVDLMRVSAYKNRQARVEAILEHYRKPDQVAEAPALDLNDREAELLKRVLGFGPGAHGITRNKYHATRGGSAHRAFEAMRDRGLVILTVEPGLWVSCEATSAGVAALRRALERRAA